MLQIPSPVQSLLGSLTVIGALCMANVSSADKFKAVTTFTVIANMAQNVAGDVAIVESITKAGAEIHGYQPTPRDIIRAQDADLIFWNGLNLELWFEQFLTNMKDDFKVYNRVYAEYFKDNLPCRTTVEINCLPTPIGIELKIIATV